MSKKVNKRCGACKKTMKEVDQNREICSSCSQKRNVARQKICREKNGYPVNQHEHNSFCRAGNHTYYNHKGATKFEFCSACKKKNTGMMI